jgi:hypothetical protein
MAREIINVGTVPNDGLGDPLRTAFTKTNNNFAELYSRETDVPTTPLGSAGDAIGMYAVSETYFYWCTGNYDGTTQIWRRVEGFTWS